MMIVFKNYLIIAFRNILKQKTYSLINIAGLAIGIACCILILLFVNDELNYDKFHKNYNLMQPSLPRQWQKHL
jgi:putative ABC transport system permease protein